jgi:non-heme chloroperoxidase
MPTVPSDDQVPIAYDISGSGPHDVVLLHGWAGSNRYWEPLLEHLDEENLRLIRIEYRGHGNSGSSANGFSHEQFTRDVLAVADAVGAEQFTLIGFSMSGRFALYITSSVPQRVRSQVLIAGVPASQFPMPEGILLDWVGRAGDAARMSALIPAFMTVPVSSGILRQFGEQAARVPAVALEQTLRMCTQTSFEDRLSRISAPTLMIAGKNDALLTPELLRAAVLERIRGARMEVLDCGHEIPIERPAETAALISQFLMARASAEVR